MIRAGRVARAGVAVAIVATALLAAGCAKDTKQTQVVKVSATDETGTITPFQRGEFRREALKSTRAALEAMQTGDYDKAAPAFSKQQMDYFRQLAAQDEEAGKVRVRAHKDVDLDVVELTNDGNEMSMTYKFTDASYYTDKGGKRLSEPANKDAEVQLTLEHVDGKKWVIIRAIGASLY